MAKKERSLRQLWISVLTIIAAFQFRANLLNLEFFQSTQDTPTHRGLPPHTCMIGNVSITMPRAPNFVIIGAQKSGTTSLFNYLLQHPDIVPNSKYITKNNSEVHFFDTHSWEKSATTTEKEHTCHLQRAYIEGEFFAEKLLNASSNGGDRELMTFEKTPKYIFLLEIAERFKRTCPWAKVVAILRDPVDRAYSQYNMVAKGPTPGGFGRLVDRCTRNLLSRGIMVSAHNTMGSVPTFSLPNLTREEEERKFTELSSLSKDVNSSVLLRGFYAIQIQRWLELFPSTDRMLVLKYDDLHRSPEETYGRILRQVGLSDFNTSYAKYKVHRRGVYKPMLNETRALLEVLFRPQNERLAGLLGPEWSGVWEK